MKKKLAIVLISAMVASMMFTGCGSGEESAEPAAEETAEEPEAEEDAYEPIVIQYENWELTVTKEEIIYDDYYKCDSLYLHITAVNNGDAAARLADISNFLAYQHEDNLDWGQIQDENGEFILNTDAAKEETPAGGSIELLYGWQLEDDSTVTISFGGYTIDNEKVTLDIEVKDRISKEWKDAAAAAAAELEEKQSVNGFDILGVSGELADGWYINSSDDKSVELMKEGVSGYVSISCADYKDSAQEWAESQAANYQEQKPITSETIGANTYVCLTVMEDQVMLFMETSEGVVKIQSMFYTLDDMRTQVEALTFK